MNSFLQSGRGLRNKNLGSAKHSIPQTTRTNPGLNSTTVSDGPKRGGSSTVSGSYNTTMRKMNKTGNFSNSKK